MPTVYVELELTAYLLSVDDCRHVIISFIEQCQYSLVNIVVNKDNTFLCTLYKSTNAIDIMSKSFMVFIIV